MPERSEKKLETVIHRKCKISLNNNINVKQ